MVIVKQRAASYHFCGPAVRVYLKAMKQGVKRHSSRIIKRAAQMWPRSVFDFDGKQTVKEALRDPGVYVLFREDVPYYVGKTEKKLFKRIQAHATKTKGRYYHFWNYFSAFAIPNPKHRDEIEGVLIASMPLANGATPKIHRIPLPRIVAKLLKGIRQKAAAVNE